MSYDPSTNTITVDGIPGSSFRGLGQFFVSMLKKLAEQPDAPASITDNWNVLQNWLGTGTLDLESSGRIGLAWQSYVALGAAPSKKLESVFEWSRDAAIREKWETILLPQAVVAVFDRMLASAEEIAEAKTRRLIRRAVEVSRAADDFYENDALRMSLATDAEGNYLIPPEEVGGLFFNDRPDAVSNIEAYIRHNLDPAILEDYAVAKLRTDVPSTDGLFDLDALIVWELRHAPALSMLPGFDAKLQDIRASLERLRLHEDYRRRLRQSPMQLFADHDPETAAKMFFQLPDTSSAMRQLVDSAEGNHQALHGLRALVIDHIEHHAGLAAQDAGSYSAFLSKHAEALTMLFGSDGIHALRAAELSLRSPAGPARPTGAKPSKKPWWRRLFG